MPPPARRRCRRALTGLPRPLAAATWWAPRSGASGRQRQVANDDSSPQRHRRPDFEERHFSSVEEVCLRAVDDGAPSPHGGLLTHRVREHWGPSTLTPQAARFLEAAVVAGLNVVVASGTQAGRNQPSSSPRNRCGGRGDVRPGSRSRSAESRRSPAATARRTSLFDSEPPRPKLPSSEPR